LTMSSKRLCSILRYFQPNSKGHTFVEPLFNSSWVSREHVHRNVLGVLSDAAALASPPAPRAYKSNDKLCLPPKVFGCTAGRCTCAQIGGKVLRPNPSPAISWKSVFARSTRFTALRVSVLDAQQNVPPNFLQKGS